MAQDAPKVPRLTDAEITAKMATGDVLLLDVRDPAEIAENGSLAGYLNIPIKELEARLSELPLDKPILTA